MGGPRYTRPFIVLRSSQADINVQERAGPGPLDPPSLAWTYHSDVSGAQDIYSGLVGAIIIYRPGELAKHTLDVPAPRGSDLTEEVLTLFMIVDENLSFYIDGNTLNRTNIPRGEIQVNRLDPGFQESNLKHAINGRLFGNLEGLTLTVGRKARWHVVSCSSSTTFAVLTIFSNHWEMSKMPIHRTGMATPLHEQGRGLML